MKNEFAFEQNDVSAMREQGIDLSERWEYIFNEIITDTHFSPNIDSLRKIQWWKTDKIGSVSCHGFIEEKSEKLPVLLKIQGTKPAMSEAHNIAFFQKQNKSKIIRSPKVYVHFPWNEQKQFEAFIVEEANGTCVIQSHPSKDKELDLFFELYEEYRLNSLNEPWLKKPEKVSYKDKLAMWMEAVKQQIKTDRLKDSGDNKLARSATRILNDSLTASSLEFMHGHFQPGDLIVNSNNSETVITSNLFWGWRNPFYDAVFGYHWWMLGMEHAENLTSKLLEKERDRWLQKIYSLSEVKENIENERLVTLALLERALPALMVDRFMIDETKPSAEIITKSAREELRRLIAELS